MPEYEEGKLPQPRANDKNGPPKLDHGHTIGRPTRTPEDIIRERIPSLRDGPIQQVLLDRSIEEPDPEAALRILDGQDIHKARDNEHAAQRPGDRHKLQAPQPTPPTPRGTASHHINLLSTVRRCQ